MLARVMEFLYLSFFPENSNGILMNIPSVKSPGPFLYSTDSSTLQPAPPHMFSSAVPSFVTSPALTWNLVNFTTSLSAGRVPAACIALVSQAGPIDLSSSGVRGKGIFQNSPGSFLATASLNCFMFWGLSPRPALGYAHQASSDMGLKAVASVCWKAMKRSRSPAGAPPSPRGGARAGGQSRGASAAAPGEAGAGPGGRGGFVPEVCVLVPVGCRFKDCLEHSRYKPNRIAHDLHQGHRGWQG
mmetsp:Transcript_62697/g.178023  ORF Transcript_62697/g.178023 Transcript_62697/m.178023 type:complete len:243 (-) Transcript_62697:1981-2709(-)